MVTVASSIYLICNVIKQILPATIIYKFFNSMISMKFGREDELESDRLSVNYVADAGYDPNAMIQVMQVLEQASGGARRPEFFSTHPNPGNRIAVIREAIEERGRAISDDTSTEEGSY